MSSSYRYMTGQIVGDYAPDNAPLQVATSTTLHRTMPSTAQVPLHTTLTTTSTQRATAAMRAPKGIPMPPTATTAPAPRSPTQASHVNNKQQSLPTKQAGEPNVLPSLKGRLNINDANPAIDQLYAHHAK
ncbi:MAG: hypothetical protein ACYTF0_02080 [Planctomycetota bacterium]|jgi:hypothetical protein